MSGMGHDRTLLAVTRPADSGDDDEGGEEGLIMDHANHHRKARPPPALAARRGLGGPSGSALPQSPRQQSPRSKSPRQQSPRQQSPRPPVDRRARPKPPSDGPSVGAGRMRAASPLEARPDASEAPQRGNDPALHRMLKVRGKPAWAPCTPWVPFLGRLSACFQEGVAPSIFYFVL